MALAALGTAQLNISRYADRVSPDYHLSVRQVVFGRVSFNMARASKLRSTPRELPPATSIAEAFKLAVAFIDGWAAKPKRYVWFRGVKDRSFGLCPGASWRDKYDELEPLLTFTQEGAPFGKIGSLDEWETYYLAQHHGIPTRLLDWTSSFAAALFFAFDGWDGTTTPCVWIMQPYLLNRVFNGWNGIISPENNPEVVIWLPRSIGRRRKRKASGGTLYDNQYPLAIYPRKTGGRLHAQQGAFTVQGRDGRDLVEVVRSVRANVGKIFARLDLSGFVRDDAFKQLATLGVRRSTVYPDLDNFVLELRDQYSW